MLSWNASHATVGCSEEALPRTGGAGLIYWGYEMSGSVGSQLTETITGSTPDEVMVRYIAGAASLAAGIYLFVKR